MTVPLPRSAPDRRRALSPAMFGAGIGALIALVTGPSGSNAEPFSGIQAALLSPRGLVFVLGGALTGALLALRPPHLPARRSRDTSPDRRWERWESVASSTGGRRLIAVVGALVLLFGPLLLPPFWHRVLVDQVGIYVLLAVGLNVVVGWAGLLDLGYVAFYAIGAYTCAWVTGALPVAPPIVLNPFLAFPVAIAVTLAAGVLLGWPTLRLRGDYLAIVTLGFGEIVRLLLINADEVTNGPRGAYGIPHFSIHIGPVAYEWGVDPLPYWYLLLFLISLVVIAFRRLENSRIGRGWTAIREDEVAAAASGVPPVAYKLLAFSIGASTAGIAGVFYASETGFVSPDNFLLMYSILVLAMVILGGLGSIPGVILGAAVLGVLPNLLRDLVPPQDRYIYVGALLVIMMVFRPQGLLPSRRRAREIRLSEAGLGGADAVGPAAERVP